MNEELNSNSEKIEIECKKHDDKICERKEEEKKVEESPVESNSDSNKSIGHFKNPSSHITSSSVSLSKELINMTPKSIHNLNLLFTQSNEKKSQYQRRIMNTTHNDFSPVENKFLNYTFIIPSPIDLSKLNRQLSDSTTKANNVNNLHESNFKNIQHMDMRNNHIQIPSENYLNSGGNHIPQYIFNNNEGTMSINIEHRHIYDSGTIYEMNKKVNRKIEFTENEINAAPVSSMMINNQNMILTHNLSNINNFDKKSSRNTIIETKERLSSEEISAEDINSDFENLVKPQPIPGLSFSKLNNNHINQGKIYLNPYSQFPESLLIPNISNNSYCDTNNTAFYQGFKMNPSEYQIKLTRELEKKTQSCKCKKSKCLKLYCECFANGEFCINCNCTDCSNVIGNEIEKEEAFKQIRDKNPVAMKLNLIKEEDNEKANNNETKVGCNCTKSNCSKKYCECYKSNVKCSEICRCRDCGNASERLKLARNSFNSSLHNEKEFPLKNPNINENEFYNYDEFSIEKISVLIKNQKIYIEKKSFREFEKLKFLKEKNYISSKYTKSDENENLSTNTKQNSAVRIIGKNESFIIEISKSIINYDDFEANYSIQTPILNKFRKRNRNSSLDSLNSHYNLNNISEYNKYTKTACETNKKIYSIANIPKGIGKKLILDDTERILSEK